MTDTPAPTSFLESIKGLPPFPWSVDPDDREGMEWNIHILDANGNRICFMANSGTGDNSKYEAAARAIASIPDMVKEIERLRERQKLFERALTTIDEKNRLIKELTADIRDLQYELQGLRR